MSNKPVASTSPTRPVPTWVGLEATDPSGALAVDAELAKDQAAEANQPIQAPDAAIAPAELPITPSQATETPLKTEPAPLSVESAPLSVEPARLSVEPAPTPRHGVNQPTPPLASNVRVLTIPWPKVPLSPSADPQRRLPIGALITGVIGELLITVGVILGLFVVWEIVWSTVEAAPLVARAASVIEERPTWVPAIEEGSKWAPEYTDDFPVAAAVSQGEPWVKLRVPRWGRKNKSVVAEGTDKASVLDKGLVGHYVDTQAPGEVGNFAVAGHRITHGEPFAKIQTLRIGDDIIVETDKYFLVYQMTSYKIVSPNDIAVIWPVPNQEGAVPVKRLITLTTCHPRYTSTHRYVIWGELAYWTDKSEGRLRALAQPVGG
ncbi:MAG: class E sortase [Bifidobacteriaceae bacterium]|jgi:sortase A|nr:class E sortase [Bifidobacteriaceae bacterium]